MNEKNHPIQELLDASLKNLRDLVDVNTIVGKPITAPDGTIIIPVSKVTFGYASGGSDLPVKENPKDLFGGGSGGGVTISPIAFIVISNGDVRLLQLSERDNNAGRVVNMVPEVIDKISSLFSKNGKDGESGAETGESAQ